MRNARTNSRQGISRANAGPFQVYTQNAAISSKRWRRLMLRYMICQAGDLTTRYKSSFRVCSPDTAIQLIESTHSPRYSISKLFTSSATTRGRRRRLQNPSYQSRVFPSRGVRSKRRRLSGLKTTLQRSYGLLGEYGLYSLSDAQILTGQLSLPSSASRADAGYTITLNDSSTCGGT